MSEKLYGVRAYWTGEKLLSRHGKRIPCPEWFISSLPKLNTVDGELWKGKGSTVGEVMKVLNSKTRNWKELRYYVYDIPSSPGTYEVRMKEMEALKSCLPSHVHVVENIQCRDTNHLYKYLDSIVS